MCYSIGAGHVSKVYVLIRHAIVEQQLPSLKEASSFRSSINVLRTSVVVLANITLHAVLAIGCNSQTCLAGSDGQK